MTVGEAPIRPELSRSQVTPSPASHGFWHRSKWAEEITITRHGRPVAVVIRPDILWARRAGGALDDADRIHELLTGAAAAPLPAEAAGTGVAGTGVAATGPGGTGLTTERAEELIAAIRAGRDTR